MDKIKDVENHKNFLKVLIEEIDMVAYGEPTIKHFATHDPDKAGYSLVQLIETSNITAHFVDIDGSGYIDIFSCKPYDVDVAIACVKRFYNFTNYQSNFIQRRAPNF
jgi:hypothetical protein